MKPTGLTVLAVSAAWSCAAAAQRAAGQPFEFL
jgi:hypothetical protein